MKGDMIHANLGSNVVVIQKQLFGISSVIKEKLGKNTSLFHSTYCIKKATYV
jgi:hypothetical protein